MFKSPSKTKERILLFGGPGVGKSSAALHIAKFYAQTSTPGTIYIADSDNAATRMLEGAYSDLTNVKVLPMYEWDDYLTLRQMKFGPNDWLSIDFISTAWQSVQDWYADQVFNRDMATQIMYARQRVEQQGDKRAMALDGWRDWPAINGMYFRWLNETTSREKVHILAIAPAKTLSDSDDGKIVSLVKNVGWRPAGQRDLIHQFHTALYLDKPGVEYAFTSVKDRERKLVTNHQNTRFSISYLQEIAGWSVE